MACFTKFYNCMKDVFCSKCCWLPCREQDEDEEIIELPIRPRTYYNRWNLPPPEVIRDHVPNYQGPPANSEARNFSNTQEARRPVFLPLRQPRGLSDGEASRGSGASRNRASRRDDPRRHTLGSGNQHLYLNPHHPHQPGHAEGCYYHYYHH